MSSLNLAAASEEITVAAVDNNQERVEITQLFNKVSFGFFFGGRLISRNSSSTLISLRLSRCAKI